MELNKVVIKNYRSIEKVEIDIDHKCKILIGFNETGKTSILKAITSMNGNFNFDYDADAKLPIDGRLEQENPIITYTFILDSDDKTSIVNRVLGDNIQKWPIAMNEDGLQKFYDSILSSIDYNIILEKGGKYYSVNMNTNTESLILRSGYFVPTDKFPEEKGMSLPGIGHAYKEKTKIFAANEELVEWKNLQIFLKDIEIKDIDNLLRNEAAEYVRKNLPEIIEWRYNESSILSEEINIESFKKNPNISVPLKNIFHLVDIYNIEETIDNALTSGEKFERLLKHLYTKATEYLHEVWPEYRHINLYIGEVAGKLHISVQDTHNPINLKFRSEGYKRFIAFLLLVGIPNRKNKNNIIILDEPDISLHPSAVGHLLQEMLKLSNNNYIFIATHSIFCIDKENIERHIIVDKNGENTEITKTTYQNFAEEEVLYNALGHSIFDVLKKKNILFEGWTDKEVFKILTEKLSIGQENIQLIDNIGITWSSSVSKVCTTLNTMITGNNRYFQIVTDNDGGGHSQKILYDKDYVTNNSEFTYYSDYVDSIQKIKNTSLEDLLPREFMCQFFNIRLQEIEKETETEFQITDETSGVINNWTIFCKKNYPQNRNLLEGYKNKIPIELRKYIDENKTFKLDELFITYGQFLGELLKKFI
ncbi:MAG: AAA family ATPase [Leptospirales bacterium]